MILPILRGLGASLAALVLLIGAAGCSDSAKPVQPVAVTEVPGLLNTAFKDAPEPAKGLAAQVVGAVEKKDWSQASVLAGALLTAPGSSAEQNKLVGRCLLAINEQVNAAAAAGDQQAEQLNQIRRAEK